MPPEDDQLDAGVVDAGAEQPQPQRQPRVARQDSDAPDQPTPEEALAEAQKRIAAEEDRRRAAERQAEEQRQRAEQAYQEAQRAKADVGSAREASLNSAIATAKARRQNAQAIKRAARESGDWDAFDKADEDFADSAADLRMLEAQKQQFEAWKAQQQRQPAQQPQQPTRTDTGYSAEAQAWIDRHPRFNTDDDYKALAIAAHGTALEQGIREGTPAYFRHIDDKLARFYPEDGTPNMNGQRRAAPASSTAAPPSRATTPNVGRRVGTDPQSVARAMGIPMDVMAEGARICGMSLEEYAKDQASILNERANGAPTGLTTSGEGTYR